MHRPGPLGLESSPCDRLKPGRLIGEKKPRQRVLHDDELRAFWQATERLGYPYGPLFRLLLITGQRKNEVAGARWPEFDLAAKLWTVPAERFKSDAVTACRCAARRWRSSTRCPASAAGTRAICCSRPAIGQVPLNGFSKAKERLDAEMLAILREADPEAVLPPFVLHDLRRTVRTRLSALRVSTEVAEM